jgi:hypothetical protein
MGEDPPTQLAERRPVVVVPRTPGPLVDPDRQPGSRPVDEFDELIDDLFGPDDAATAGLLDLALLAGGTAAIVWSLVSIHSDALLVVGGILLLLGVALPTRNLWRHWAGYRAERRRAAVLEGAVVLDVGHPLTKGLASAYEDLVGAAASAGSLSTEVGAAAHLALTEACSLLEADVPATPAENLFVERRVEAMQAVTAAIRRLPQPPSGERAVARLRERQLERERLRPVGAVRSGALAPKAGEEDEISGPSALTDLHDLAEVFEEAGSDRSA